MKSIIAALTLAFAASMTGCAQAPWSKPQVTTPPTTQATVQPKATTPQPVAQAAAVAAPQPVAKPAATATSSTVSAKQPSEYRSLQPFKKDFAKGEGKGYAKEYKNRNKAQLIALLQNPKQWDKEMSVPCDVWVKQVMEAHPGLVTFEGCEGAAAAISRDSNFAIVSCRDEMFQKDNSLVVKIGKDFGSHNRKCYVGEQVLVYKNQVLASVMCFNPALPVPQPAVARSATSQGVACPNGRFFLLRAFSRASMGDTPLGREADRLMAIADKRDGKDGEDPDVFVGDALSTTLGPWLNRELTPAKVELDAIIQFWRRELSTGKIVRREAGFAKMRDGAGEFRFNEDPTKYVATSATFRKNEVLSPAVSGGRRQLVEQKWKSCGIRLNVVVP